MYTNNVYLGKYIFSHANCKYITQKLLVKVYESFFLKKTYFALIRFKGFKSHQKRGKGHITLHTRLIRRKQLVL